MNTLTLIRTSRTDKQTLGVLTVHSPKGEVLFECRTLELPWRENVRNISCIPEGTYPIRSRVSQKYGAHLHILDVPDRSLILIHEANFVRQLRGCIAVGKKHVDIDGDGLQDVTNSIITKRQLLKYVDGLTEITIL